MNIVEGIAHITCSCGEKLQVVNQTNNDWDEQATATVFNEHLVVCPNAQ